MKFKEFIKIRQETILKELSESSLSRVWQYVESDKIFCFVSASRIEYSKKENDERTKQLKNDIRNLGYGYIELRGGFVETVEDDSGQDVKVKVEEDSFLIPNIKKSEAIELGNKYGQDSILYKDNNGFFEFATKDNSGKILTTFKSGSGKDNLNFSKDVISNFFSKLKKGKYKDKKFVFSLKENQKIKTYTGYTNNWKKII